MLAARPAQVRVMPGSVVRGEQVLTAKGCLNCHDFAHLPSRNHTPERFAAEMWNHMPKMWSEFKAANLPAVTLTSAEASDLFSYLYTTLYFAPSGDAARGRTLFENKQCASCHSEVLDTRPSRSRAEKWTELRDPSIWAERMWNHASEMGGATSNRGVKWPQLSEQDAADLMAFLSKSDDAASQVAAFGVGEPEMGRNVFERSCESCHTFGRADASKVDLLARPRPSSVTGYVAAMWNHAPVMRKRGGATVKVDAGEMRDLVAFLFTARAFFDQGNATRGRAIFTSKGCESCHETRRKEFGAPDLTQLHEAFSPITLTAAAWRHGPSMLAAMKQAGLAWPEFQGSEMTDLIAYMNSRLVTRIGSRN